MEFKLIVFDMDGVLVDSSRCHERAYNDLWKSCDVEGPSYQNIAGKTTREVLEAYSADLSTTDKEIEEWVLFKQERARDYLVSETIGFDDVLPCLLALREAELTLAIGTGASRDTTRMILHQLGITDFFSVVVAGDDVKKGKPDPEIYYTVMAQAGKSSQETVIIEDSMAGLQAAIPTGAKVINVRTGLTLRSPAFLGSFPDLPSAVTKLGIAI